MPSLPRFTATKAAGTGLALQLGYRYFEDLHFFHTAAFDIESLISRLSKVGPLTIQSRSGGTLHTDLEGLRLSFLRMQAPLLYPGQP